MEKQDNTVVDANSSSIAKSDSAVDLEQLVMPHKGCKHLDYEEGKYTNCKIVTLPSDMGKYWERGEIWTQGGENPKNVQFCKLRGRINGIFQCINKGEMSCYEE